MYTQSSDLNDMKQPMISAFRSDFFICLPFYDLKTQNTDNVELSHYSYLFSKILYLCIPIIRDELKESCLPLIKEVTGIPLNDTIDLTCSKYDYTGNL